MRRNAARSHFVTGALVLIAVASVACAGKKSGPGVIKVAAASDLQFAFEELGPAFEKASGKKVEFTFGSTGQFAQQIGQGAPYDVFAAANVAYVDGLVKSGDCDGATRQLYARGRIVLWTKRGPAPAALAELADPRYKKIAIANPEHAPYGKAARQALEAAGVWPQIEKRLVYGENIRQTMQLAETGNAEVAVVALSLALGAKGAAYTLIDDALHKPIDQGIVACRHGNDAATAAEFVRYVNSDAGRAIMKRYGFLLPGEALVKN